MFVGPGQLRFDEVEPPTILEPTDALVRPLAATTCDLDQGLIADKTPFSAAGPFPLGHECVGTVVEVGQECTTISVGDRVGVAWHIACGTCIQCVAGQPARCLVHGDSQIRAARQRSWGRTSPNSYACPTPTTTWLRCRRGRPRPSRLRGRQLRVGCGNHNAVHRRYQQSSNRDLRRLGINRPLRDRRRRALRQGPHRLLRRRSHPLSRRRATRR